MFDNERIINIFDPRGVPWGFTTPRQAYKMAAGACWRVVSDTSLNQSGFSYHKMPSVRISIYETLGIVAGGKDLDIDDDDDYEYDINQFIDDRSIVADEEEEEDNYIAEKEIAQIKKQPNGLLTRIYKAHATICPEVQHGCFYDAIKLGMIYNLQPESYTSKLKNIQRHKLINKEYEKLFIANTDVMNPPQFVIEEDFPEDVPLNKKFFQEGRCCKSLDVPACMDPGGRCGAADTVVLQEPSLPGHNSDSHSFHGPTKRQGFGTLSLH